MKEIFEIKKSKFRELQTECGMARVSMPRTEGMVEKNVEVDKLRSAVEALC